MNLYIYKEYTALKNKNLKKSINPIEEKIRIDEHKAKIVMELILEFIHEGKSRDEEVEIEKKSFLHFTRRIQRKLGNRAI